MILNSSFFRWTFISAVFIIIYGLECSNGEKLDTLKLLEHIQDLRMSGNSNSILNGMQNDDNAQPFSKSQQLYDTKTSDIPAMWGSDFHFTSEQIESRSNVVEEAIEQYQQDSVVTLSWHICNPRFGEPCYWDAWWDYGISVAGNLNDEDWNDLFVEGTPINQNLYEMFDTIALYLQQLQNAGVEVLFRPFHEINQDWFWWGGRPGPNGSSRLFKAIHDYYTNDWQLTNLVWVYDLQDFDTLTTDVSLYDPGTQYWDVLALDFYLESTPAVFTQEKYNIISNYALQSALSLDSTTTKPKPIAIGECEVIPTSQILQNQPLWTYFLLWADVALNNPYNQPIFWQTFQDTMSQQELQGWHTWPAITGAETSTGDDVNCGCSPTECSDSVLNTIVTAPTSDYSTCREYIVWHKQTFNLEEQVSCRAAGYVFPNQCGPCNPDTCTVASPTTPSPVAVATTSPPTMPPTPIPTKPPTLHPTRPPTHSPTSSPTSIPTSIPTAPPTAEVILISTRPPTELPTLLPTNPPTSQPTSPPTTQASNTDIVNYCDCLPSVCTNQVLNTNLGNAGTSNYSTCREYIEWHLATFNFGTRLACLAAGYSFANQCGACNPDFCPK